MTESEAYRIARLRAEAAMIATIEADYALQASELVALDALAALEAAKLTLETVEAGLPPRPIRIHPDRHPGAKR